MFLERIQLSFFLYFIYPTIYLIRVVKPDWRPTLMSQSTPIGYIIHCSFFERP